MPTTDESTLAVWAAKLNKLIEAGSGALGRGDTHEVARVQESLRQFPMQSPPAADALDRTALLAAVDLDIRNSVEAAERLSQRLAEIQDLTRLIAGVASEAEGDAKTLRMHRVQRAVASTTETIAALKALSASLKNQGADKGMADDVNKLLTGLQGLRDALELN